MIKNSSSLAVAALLLNSSITEEVSAAQVEQKATVATMPFDDVEALQIDGQLAESTELDTMEDLERRHHRSSRKARGRHTAEEANQISKHKILKQAKQAQIAEKLQDKLKEQKAQQDYLMQQHLAVEKLRTQKQRE